jgi:hypothetical protein
VSAAPHPPIGLCHCCGTPVLRGSERRETIEQGSGAAPDVLLHSRPCKPPSVRTWT